MALAVAEAWALMEVAAVEEVTEADAASFVASEATSDHDLVNVDVAEMTTAVFVSDISSCSSGPVATSAAAAVEASPVAADGGHGEELQQQVVIACLRRFSKTRRGGRRGQPFDDC